MPLGWMQIMNKKVFLKRLKEFLIDSIPYTIIYFLSGLIIIGFYRLSIGKKAEILYPFVLTAMIYMVFTLIRAYSYIKIRYSVDSYIEDVSIEKIPKDLVSCEQRYFVELLSEQNEIHKDYLLEIGKATDEKNNIIVNIIHGIKTPASVIDLIIQNINEDPEDVFESLKKIEKQNLKIVDGLNQVLDYLRLEKIHQDYIIEEVDLINQLREKINSKKELFIYNNVFPIMDVSFDESVKIYTDKKWNGILLEQIISNAIKYTKVKDGDRFVYFSIQKSNDNVDLVIKDTGIGIDEKDLKRIYEPFFTGSNGRIHKNSSGIGLYICKNIVKELNHYIEITSKVNEFTSVLIRYSYLTKM
jgi:two-component system, OmpR family, sensor histidine kinase YxdK